MINVMWVIVPWVAIIIFAAGWILGSRRSVFRVRYECRKEQEQKEKMDDLHFSVYNTENQFRDRFDDIERTLRSLEGRIIDIVSEKEEK